jgi:hypothetical protein
MLTLARTTIIIALFMAIQPAHAQRCPAGADAFGSCLPLHHRYGGPGQIQRGGPRPEDFKCKPWHPPETCTVVRSIGEAHRKPGKAR